jgi:hypothetical protein
MQTAPEDARRKPAQKSRRELRAFLSLTASIPHARLSHAAIHRDHLPAAASRGRTHGIRHGQQPVQF